MIDTLKFAKHLDQVATKQDLEILESRLSNKLYGVGFSVVLALGLIQHFLR
jgi:ribosomal protein S4